MEKKIIYKLENDDKKQFAIFRKRKIKLLKETISEEILISI